MAALALLTALAIALWGPAEAQAHCNDADAVPDSTNSDLVGDCNTLLSLMGTLAGTANLNWSENTPISSWNGITLSGGPQRVTGLELPSPWSLSGSIPSGLGDLSSLTTLDLSGNQLTGPIPSGLGDLSNLTTLNLSTNQLSGPIPSELGGLSSLGTLNLSTNQLSGPIPSELGGLSSLGTLDLSTNQLHGVIPSELGGLSNLGTLGLSTNQLHGVIPSELGDLSSLSALDLADNGLSGSIPSKLGNLSNLTGLNLSGNELDWEIPEELNQLDTLEEVSLNGNLGLIGPAHLDFTKLSKVHLGHMETETWAVADFSSATTWSLAGDDRLKFSITGDGVLTFLTAPDYEVPSDNGLDNTYSVDVKGDVGGVSVTEKTAQVSVTVMNRHFALSVSPGSIAEDASSKEDFTVTATLDVGTTLNADTTIAFSLLGAATGSGTDYTAVVPSDITISAGVATGTATLSIEPTDDGIVEGEETIRVEGAASNIKVSPAWITISDDDSGELSLSVPDTDVAEDKAVAEDPDTSFEVTVALSHAIGPEVTVVWSVTPDSATSDDYCIRPGTLNDDCIYLGTLTFPAGSAVNSTKSFDISVVDDKLSEGDESFTVILGGVTGDISDSISVDPQARSAELTITGSDPIKVTLWGDSSVDEGGLASYTVSLDGVTPTADLTVAYATGDPDDTAGSDDYQEESGTLTFTSSDAAVKTVTVQSTEDSMVEDDETFSFGLANVDGGGGPTPSLDDPPSITTIIIDDDRRGTPRPPANDAPTFNEGATTTRVALENSEVGTEVREPVRATDRDGDRLEYRLQGTDLASFHLDPLTGQLTTASLLDYETQSEYSVRVRVRDGEGGIDGIDVTITIVDLDEAPSQPGAPEVRSTGPTGLAISWTAPDNQGPEITDYDVRYREAGGEFQDAELVGADTSITLNNLKSGTSYEVQVRAVNAEGVSPWSESGRDETEEAPPTPTPTPSPEPTLSPSPEPTPTPALKTVPPATSTPTPEPTVAPTSTATPEPTVAPTSTATPMETAGPTATSTPAPAFTSGPTGTPVPTPTLLPVTTPTTEPTATPTSAPKPTRIPVPVSTDATALAPTPTPTVGPVPPEGNIRDGGFPWWVIVGVVVIGVVAGVVLIVGVRRSRR